MKCDDMSDMDRRLMLAYYREPWDYGLSEDESQHYPSDSPISAASLTLLHRKAASLSPDRYTTVTEIDGSVTILPSMHTGSELDLRYIVHVTLSHSGPDIIRVAQPFTNAFLEHLPDWRSVYLNFRQASTPGLASLPHSTKIEGHPSFG
ncbi:hypothetical protein BO99DRAFT_37188 [Aspergillus violaceofuscus CBS 115571]|uniref:Uncharacterized protein n=1 Tax=Aspergillus violaceofuscus (strain CBS 115571) TaxID=1450538 RepID=A0A2V5GSC0_ASPV1|nr:hypothetical protein BO99DRAFT_37188 [Aspergillus violaceofuscus CBS 115571]